MKEKVLVLLSGGLDSQLAVKILQGKFDVMALYFKLPFSKDVENKVREFSKKNKIKLKVLDCTKGKLLQEYLDIVKKPKHGRGTCMNPCIDCRIFILKKAKKFADKNKIKLIATGEVSDERPMSQNKKAMNIIEKESGLDGRLIRPLCDIGIHGRSRKKQIALAQKYRISYPQPGGGCLLCEKGLKERIKNLLKKKDVSGQDARLINIGRHFESSNIILGRNKEENEILEKCKGIKIISKQPGPSVFVNGGKYEKRAKKLIQKYSKHKIREFEVKK